MEILTIKDVPYNQNCYLIINDKKEVVIIDPGYQLAQINSKLKELNLNVKAILLTHYHFDHDASANELANKWKVKILIHELDRPYAIKDTLTKWAGVTDFVIDDKLIDTFVDEVYIEGFNIKAIHSPGHTEGSTLFLIDDKLFTGDVLFIDSIGRYDLKGSDFTNHKNTLKSIYKMNDSLIVMPGHGEISSLKNIKKTNVIFNEIIKIN